VVGLLRGFWCFVFFLEGERFFFFLFCFFFLFVGGEDGLEGGQDKRGSPLSPPCLRKK